VATFLLVVGLRCLITVSGCRVTCVYRKLRETLAVVRSPWSLYKARRAWSFLTPDTWLEYVRSAPGTMCSLLTTKCRLDSDAPAGIGYYTVLQQLLLLLLLSSLLISYNYSSEGTTVVMLFLAIAFAGEAPAEIEFGAF